MKMVDIKCKYCNKIVKKPEKEINRQKRNGKNNFFCSLSCTASYGNIVVDIKYRCRNNRPFTTEDIAKIRRKKEKWKYEKIEIYLKENGFKYIFEYPFIKEKIIYDLALPLEKILIEFDGKYHQYTYARTIDEKKDEVAIKYGWRLIRIPVKENAEIKIDNFQETIKSLI